VSIAVVAGFVGFLLVFGAVPYAARYLYYSGIRGVDQQKLSKPSLPTSGGTVVFFGFLTAISLFIAGASLLNATSVDLTLMLAGLASVSIITMIGLIDDIHVDLEQYAKDELGIKDLSVSEGREYRKGMEQLPKALFVLPAVLPLAAIGAGSWEMALPVLGVVNWGYLYPLLLLPIGLLFVSNVVNMLAGTNGLSALLCLITALGIGVFAALNQRFEAAAIALVLAGCLGGFLFHNLHPASVLPGDSLTYLAGAGLFSAIVIGNIEKFGVFVSGLWFVEFFLKARSRFEARSWGDIQEDGTLQPFHNRTYSLTHPLMRRGLTEPQVTLVLGVLQSFLVVSALFLFVLGPL
jgi:UDP-N-acetylmuramyl pentapeptide phosphotransferase/UDP-N-acetylglucosamine-1-phosphate transferase